MAAPAACFSLFSLDAQIAQRRPVAGTPGQLGNPGDAVVVRTGIGIALGNRSPERLHHQQVRVEHLARLDDAVEDQRRAALAARRPLPVKERAQHRTPEFSPLKANANP